VGRFEPPLLRLRANCLAKKPCLSVVVVASTPESLARRRVGPPPEQDIPLDIPKKTKLYIEQTARERDSATEMHRIFQRDLCKLRLSTARSYYRLRNICTVIRTCRLTEIYLRFWY
jgi:hypothetical protein